MLATRFFKQGSDFLGVKYPILCGAMTWVSEPTLVSAVSNAGGFGVLAGGNTPVDILEKQIQQTRTLTSKNFAVNLVTVAPNYRPQIEMLKRTPLPYVVFAGGLPKQDEIKAMKDQGAKVLCFAPTLGFAERLVKWGADALVIEGREAGGHVGPVSTIVLVQQILFNMPNVPVFVAGGLATGKMCAHLFLMGAAGVQLGTRFAVAAESKTHPAFKEALLKADARDAISTPQFDARLPVIPVRAVKNKGHDEFAKLQLELVKHIDAGTMSSKDASHKLEEFWMGALRRAAVDGDIERGSLMAGQSVGLVDKVESVQAIVDDLVSEMEKEFQTVKARMA